MKKLNNYHTSIARHFEKNVWAYKREIESSYCSTICTIMAHNISGKYMSTWTAELMNCLLAGTLELSDQCDDVISGSTTSNQKENFTNQKEKKK